MEFKLALLTESHIKKAAEIEKRCFSCPWSEGMLRDELYNPGAVYLAAEVGGILAGYAGMRTVLDEGYITNIAVDEPYRRAGIGSALLRALISAARAHGLAFITLEVRSGNAVAISLYRAHGFAPCGIRKNYYERPREDAVLMTLYFTEAPRAII